MENKVSFFHSIKFKIMLIVQIAIIATVGIILILTVPLMNSRLTELTKNSMIDIALVAGENIDNEIMYIGADTILLPDALATAVGSVDVKGMESSYAYVIDTKGIMLYHPNTSKIGQPVENAGINQLLGEIEKGNRPETSILTYDFNGVAKYASYYIGKNAEFIFIITADEAEVRNSIYSIISRSVLIGLLALVVCGAVGLIAAIRMTRPITKVTGLVLKLAELDFIEDDNMREIINRSDETGVMAKAVDTLQKELADVIRNIRMRSSELFEASGAMSKDAEETSTAVDQVEVAINDIATGATSQAEETQTATDNVIVMGNMVEETNLEVEQLRTNAGNMQDAGDEAIRILKELNDINQKTREAIELIGEQTKNTNESVLQIKSATDIISSIADETNLLSLNASIEAARAGEQGRGFAVVASQIQKLADQSNASAGQIADTVNVLIANSEKTMETMEEVRKIIEMQNKDVENTQAAFGNVKNGIDKSIESITSIADKTDKLDKARINVVDVVQSLTAIAEENAASSEETSASATEVGAIVADIAENAKKLALIAEELEEGVKQFNI